MTPFSLFSQPRNLDFVNRLSQEVWRRKRGTIRENKDDEDCQREESLSELDKGREEGTQTDELEDEVESTQEYQDRMVL